MTGVKWVSPSGTLEEASEEKNPELLPLIRASYGLAGIVYEVTFKIKPLEIIEFDYEVLDVAAVTQDHISEVIASNECMVCWTVGHRLVIQTRNRARKLKHHILPEARRFGWSFLGAFAGRAIRQTSLSPELQNAVEDLGLGIELGFYQLLSATGGFTLLDPDKMINYAKTPKSGRYAFTFWAFPRADWVKNLNDYVDFADKYFAKHGFRCNMPLGSYFIRQDTELAAVVHPRRRHHLPRPDSCARRARPGGVGQLPACVQRVGAPARGHSAVEPEPVHHERACRCRVRRSLEDAVRLGPNGRSRGADGQSVFRGADGVTTRGFPSSGAVMHGNRREGADGCSFRGRPCPAGEVIGVDMPKGTCAHRRAQRKAVCPASL